MCISPSSGPNDRPADQSRGIPMSSRRALLPLILFGVIAGSCLFGPDVAFAQEEAAETAEAAAAFDGQEMAFDNFVLFMCAVLVLFMQAGFAMVEAGFNSQKNVINILFKNLMDICVGVILYAVVGFNLMYPGEWFVEGVIGQPSMFLTGGAEFDETPASVDDGLLYHAQSDYLFQVAFAATAATIVSGAVAGRMQFKSYLIYSAILTAILYPISGSWKWGGGWLDAMGFYDFAGSCVVHAVGGFAGLAGAIVLGPRLGRYTADGKSTPLPGHSITIATLGVFILWIGWYGFNPGSQLTFGGAGNATAVARIAVNTTLSAAAGGFTAMLLSWVLFSKPDISMALNGVLAGLVGITANCDGVTNPSAVIIGLVSGVLVVLGILMLDKLKIDDPVGAWPVHGLCGAWGCIACAIFQKGDYWGEASEGIAYGNWGAQLTGTFAYCVYAFATFFVLFSILKAAGILRVSAEEEEAGLDVSEHGMRAYAELKRKIEIGNNIENKRKKRKRHK
eukprot:TRINITY_DN13201_c0_g1_i1.p1 TRINITY_DN13201_c0_g1~~TRINITY_DN13201_c0_g1_i1.p1  ORF type:complete len:507 (+),score=62.65 TRINITY_DN13201_c0_g1_i1:97-1617(+)